MNKCVECDSKKLHFSYRLYNEVIRVECGGCDWKLEYSKDDVIKILLRDDYNRAYPRTPQPEDFSWFKGEIDKDLLRDVVSKGLVR